LRQSANAPEQIAWSTLRILRQHGFPVRRQHPIGPYIVDFAVIKARLVIEIDGGIHALSEVAQRDATRQQANEALGWRVIRIPSEVAFSTDHLLEITQRELGL
jgi:very-short-patch-repair endonuclease